MTIKFPSTGSAAVVGLTDVTNYETLGSVVGASDDPDLLEQVESSGEDSLLDLSHRVDTLFGVTRECSDDGNSSLVDTCSSLSSGDLPPISCSDLALVSSPALCVVEVILAC